jgi:hypothetical protein
MPGILLDTSPCGSVPAELIRENSKARLLCLRVFVVVVYPLARYSFVREKPERTKLKKKN